MIVSQILYSLFKNLIQMNLVVIFLVPLMTGLTIGQGICLHFTGPNLDV